MTRIQIHYLDNHINRARLLWKATKTFLLVSISDLWPKMTMTTLIRELLFDCSWQVPTNSSMIAFRLLSESFWAILLVIARPEVQLVKKFGRSFPCTLFRVNVILAACRAVHAIISKYIMGIYFRIPWTVDSNNSMASVAWEIFGGKYLPTKTILLMLILDLVDTLTRILQTIDRQHDLHSLILIYN